MAEVTKELIKELREKTGAGLVDCKKALQDTGGDIEESIKILREKGLSSAAKRSERKASEGIIHIARDDAANKTVMVELNCETDFVAKTDDFQNTAKQIAETALKANISALEQLNSATIEGGSSSVQDWVKEKIGIIGENIVLSKLALVQGNDKSYIAQYIHGNSKIGVLVEFELGNNALSSNDQFLELANGICMHIAAVNPAYLNKESVDANELAKEREIYRNQMLEQGKPENIVDKIVEGKMAKFYEEVCLLEQEYVVQEDKKKVHEVIAQVSKAAGESVSLKQYIRFELGV